MTGVSRAPGEEGGVGLARAGRLHVLPQAPGQGAARSATYQLSGAQQPEVGSYFRVFNNSRLYRIILLKCPSYFLMSSCSLSAYQ